ncbi:hypothetical protein CTheo_895 [Ceratobasidium theobromae]|uniref:Uncharacterized protein n=1 Tax=Ceratobasidium theobromae TaxID=1582974 RepID=A0A5N5QWW7_9AGAM|nr:hypothetical protein CTheo_895 [Ceratobasidium theobromae]
MTRTSISTPKLARIDAKQAYDSKTRSRISLFARSPHPFKPIRSAKASSVRSGRSSKHGIANGDIAERKGSRHATDGLAQVSAANAHYRGVSGMRNKGLDHSGTPPHGGIALVERGEPENEELGTYQDSDHDQESDEEWQDERTLIDGLMGFDDQSIHDRTKRQEALTDALRGHFSSLSISIKQDLYDAVVPVIDDVSTAIRRVQQGPDSEYKDGFLAFNQTANGNLAAVRVLNEQFGQLGEQSLTRLKHVVGRIETERARRAELCSSFKEQYMEICRERLTQVAGQDLDQAAAAVEMRAQVIINGKDKDKAKMRQKILKAFA